MAFQKEIKTTRIVRESIYYAGPESDKYLAIDLGKIQVFEKDELREGDEVNVTIIIQKRD